MRDVHANRVALTMYFSGIGTASPTARYSKAECLEAFQGSAWFARLDTRAHFIARTVLQRDNGIESRSLAVDTLAEVFEIDPNTLATRFLMNAPALAAQAGARALVQAGLQASEIGAVVVSTCTGYVCPGLTGHVAERLGLRADVQAFDLVGQGCAAALPNFQLGRALLASGRADGQGRVAAFEIMKGTKAIANLIRENKVYQIPSIIQTGAHHGMVLYEKYVDDLVKKGLVTMADAKSFLGKDAA